MNLVGFSFFYVKAWSSVLSPCLWLTASQQHLYFLSFCGTSSSTSHPHRPHEERKILSFFPQGFQYMTLFNIQSFGCCYYHEKKSSSIPWWLHLWTLFSGDEEWRVWLWCSLLIVDSVMILHTAFQILLELHFDWSQLLLFCLTFWLSGSCSCFCSGWWMNEWCSFH